MKPLRAFLFTQGPSDEWTSTPFRELEPLLDAIAKALAMESASAAIHIGFWRPETSKIAELAQQWSGRLLISEAAGAALPPPLSLSQFSVGEIDGLAFRVALDGFGYQIDDPRSGQPINSRPTLPNTTNSSHSARGWVEKLIQDKPETVPLLSQAGIWDDGSYHENEPSLETVDRITLAKDRYSTVTGVAVNQSNILNNLHACPHWFLNYELQRLDLTVRTRNVLKAHNISAIGDLASKGYVGLLKLPNMGQGSVHGLGTELWKAFINGDALKRARWKGSDVVQDGPHNLRIPDEITFENSTPLTATHLSADNLSVAPTQVSPLPQPAPTITDIVGGIIATAQALTKPEQGIWAARLGFRCEQRTLQVIADEIGISRERVRQIEVKIYKKIRHHPFWKDLSSRLNTYLTDRTSPLLLNGISAIDPWFKGAEKLKTALQEVFKHILHHEFSVLNLEETPVISHLQLSRWEDAINKGKALLREMVAEKVSEDYAKGQVGALISGRGEELRDELWATVRSFALWATKPDGAIILAGYGRTAEAVVTAVLESAGHPLHYEEIYRRSKLISDKEHIERALHNAASNVAVLYNRGTYGLLSHCPLNTEELALIEAEVEDITAGADPTKQWHNSELLDELLERGFDFDGKLTKYIINIALHNSQSLVNMRRMVWGYKDSWQASAASRLDMRQAVMALLEEAGHPLSTLEIRQRLEGDRGLNNHFQIHPLGNLIRLGTGLWGLADRDVKVGDPNGLLDRLTQHMQATQEGVHVSEVASVLGDIDENDALALLGLVRQKGMRRDRAQYVYLSVWDDARRIWPARAIEQALDAHPEGMTIEQVRFEVSRLTKRELNGLYIGQMLSHTEGSSYNPETELWSREQVSAEESDVSEEETTASD
jgi:Bacterial RNA polymerase, alpha chain C terminal domain/Sigma-70, region 4